MCQSVSFENRWYTTPQQLAELVGGVDRIVWKPQQQARGGAVAFEGRRLDQCLCAVDLGTTLASAGFAHRQGEDPMEWYIERRANA